MKRKKKSDCRLRLNDEAPRLGSGVRGVQIVKQGPKWVVVRETATGIRAKIDRRTFDAARRAANP